MLSRNVMNNAADFWDIQDLLCGLHHAAQLLSGLQLAKWHSQEAHGNPRDRIPVGSEQADRWRPHRAPSEAGMVATGQSTPYVEYMLCSLL